VSFPAGSKISAFVKIPQPTGVLLAPFFIEVN
jgi:hypothetical protein